MPAVVKVLVVDDDFGFRRAIGDALTDLGWEVRSAATGTDALAVLQTWRPHVILLDLILPVMDGWAFRAEAERQSGLENIPTIVTSAVAEVAREAERLRVAAALRKPFELDELISTIRRLAKTETDEGT